MLAVRIAGVGHDRARAGHDRGLALHRHRMQLLQVIALVREVERDDRLVPGIDHGCAL